MIPAYAIVKKAAALVNHKAGRLGDAQKDLIIRVCDEILEGQHRYSSLSTWPGSSQRGAVHVQGLKKICERRGFAR